MTPRAHRRKLAAAALAVACVIIYLWMLYAWETAWGMIGGPQRLVDGLEDRLKGRVVERMTWAM